MTVSSQRAEQSRTRVNRALAYFRDQNALQPASRGVAGLRGWAAVPGAASYQSHDAILRLVAIAEDFSVGRFVDAIQPLLPVTPIVSDLWEAELDRSAGTSPNRRALWKRYKNVKITDFPRNKELDAFIAARNIIAHGLGSLTRRQLRNRPATIQTLNEAKITVRGDELLVADTHVELCAEVVKEFVAWLDACS